MLEPSTTRSQRQRILNAIRAAGKDGATNLTLNAIALRYGARIHEMRADGYDIRSVRVSDQEWRFVLISEPLFQQRKIA